MSLEAFRADLKKETPGSWHDELLLWCRDKVKSSRSKMNEYYDSWDKSHAAFKAEVEETREDRAAEKRNEPKRQAIPVAFAQAETFVSFLLTLFTQRERMFEMKATGEEDYDAARLAEATISRDLRDNVFETKLYKFLLNVAKYGIGVFKVTWKEEFAEVEQAVPEAPLVIAGQELPAAGGSFRSYVKVRAGNRIEVISPYHFFPDPNFSMSQFQEGEFVASEAVKTRQSLTDMESRDEVVGVKYIGSMGMEARSDRERLLGSEVRDNPALEPRDDKGMGPVVITEVQATLIPSAFELEGKPLGEQDYPVKFLIWIANDNRIINIEPLSYPHGQYCYVVGEFTADDEEMVSNSLVDNIRPLQDTASWLVSSHVANVRQVINNRLVVDPSAINVNDILEKKPFITLKASASGQDAARAIKQLEVRDVTGSHMGDSKQMYDLAQIVTGVSDNAMGQFSSGRRSALEARNVNAGAAMRLKMHGILLFRNALEPMARMMLKNLRQWLDVETFVEVRGELADPAEYAKFVSVTSASLMGSYDFEVFDGTLPSERGAQAQALQEFLQFLGANPEAIALLGYDPREIMKEWLLLRGIRNPDRFKIDALRQMEIQAQMQQYGIGTGQNGVGGGTGSRGTGGSTGGASNPAVKAVA